MKKKALILIDIQNDFLPGGSLAVSEGDKIIPIVNDLMLKDFDYVVASLDWHPSQHGSFAETHGLEIGQVIELEGIQQFLWPVHCVQDTFGASLASSLKSELIDYRIYKGTDPKIDSYSTFFDNNHLQSTGLDELLKQLGVKDVFITGLATDYCVKFSVLDAIQCGYKTHLITDAIRGVNIHPGDVDQAITEMKEKGAILLSSTEL
jgi:nicotinamidase/pyrazinamidase